MLYYFAYGSNMCPDQMALRCPGARALGPARLQGWRFHVTTRGTASILPDEGHAVHGVLWRCRPEHLFILDRFEGVAWRNYFRRSVIIESRAHGPLRALTYASARTWPGRARANYMLTRVLPAAKTFALPPGYIEELESWLPARPLGERGTRYVGRTRPLRFPR